MDQDEAMMVNYLLIHQQYFKTTLLKPLKSAGPSMYQEMNARWILATEFCLKLSLSVDVVLNFLDKVNMKELL